MRAVKRSGEILGGSYMVGAKWAVSDSASEFWLTHSSFFMASRTKRVQMKSSLKQLAVDWCPIYRWKRRRQTRWSSTRFHPPTHTRTHLRMEHQSDWHPPLRLFENQASLRPRDSKGRWRQRARLRLGCQAGYLQGSHQGRGCWARCQI
jgi:hypothetical protein